MVGTSNLTAIPGQRGQNKWQNIQPHTLFIQPALRCRICRQVHSLSWHKESKQNKKNQDNHQKINQTNKQLWKSKELNLLLKDIKHNAAKSSASVELSVPPGGRFSSMAPFQKTHSHFNHCSFTDPWDISSTFRKALATISGKATLHWPLLTLQAVSIEQVLALLVALDPALPAAHSLPCDAPQQSLTFIAVGRSCGCPHFEVVWGCTRDGID